MESTTTTQTPTERAAYRRRLPIEKYALLTENAPEIDRILQEWYDFYRPATPGECTLLDIAVMAHVQQQRVLGCLTETVNNAIRTARFQFDCNQEDQVQRYRDLLETQPGVAVVGLNRSALGVRFLIGRWERLLAVARGGRNALWQRSQRVYQLPGGQGDPARGPARVGRGLPDMDLLFDVSAQAQAPGHHRHRQLCATCRRASMTGTAASGWGRQTSAASCSRGSRRNISRTCGRGKSCSGPTTRSRRGRAPRSAQVLQGPVGVQLQRNADAHERQYLRAYNAFLKGRAQSEKSERLPGEPCPDLHGASVVRPEPAPDTGSAGAGRGRAEAGCRGAGAGRGERHRRAVRPWRRLPGGGAGGEWRLRVVLHCWGGRWQSAPTPRPSRAGRSRRLGMNL